MMPMNQQPQQPGLLMRQFSPMARDYHEEQARITADSSQMIAPGMRTEDFMRAAEHVPMDQLLNAVAQLRGTSLIKMPDAAGVK